LTTLAAHRRQKHTCLLLYSVQSEESVKLQEQDDQEVERKSHPIYCSERESEDDIEYRVTNHHIQQHLHQVMTMQLNRLIDRSEVKPEASYSWGKNVNKDVIANGKHVLYDPDI